MSIDNLPGESTGPVDDAPKSEAELVSDIADLLDDDPETDLAAGKEDQAKAAPADDGDDPDIDVTEDVEDEADAEDSDGPQDAEIKGGRFAPDSAKVTLDDGTVITVAELKRNNLFQRGFTEKTQALAKEREAFHVEREQVTQQAQSLQQLADFLDHYGQQFMPEPPEPFTGDPATDPIGFMQYQHAANAYNTAMGQRQYLQAQRDQLIAQQQAEQSQKANEAFAAELNALTASEPAFWGDTAKMKAFVGELLEKGNEWWGLSKEDIAAFRSQKHWKIVRDALRYRKALAKAPDVQKQVQSRPVMNNGGRRMDPKVKGSAERQARSEQLRRDGRFENGVAALMDFDL